MKKLNKNTARAVVRRAIALYGLRLIPGDYVYVVHKYRLYSVIWLSSSQLYLVKRRCDDVWNLVNDGMF